MSLTLPDRGVWTWPPPTMSHSMRGRALTSATVGAVTSAMPDAPKQMSATEPILMSDLEPGIGHSWESGVLVVARLAFLGLALNEA